MTFFNNTVKLTGNLGSEARILEKEGRTFAAFSIATVDSYLDKAGYFQPKPTVWHDILAFSPQVVQQVKSLKKGTRLELTGSLSYRPFTTVLEDGRTVTKQEASVIIHKVELKPLVKKTA